MAKLKLIEFDLCVWLYKGDPSFAVVNQRMRETGCKWMARLKVSVHFDQLKLLDQVLFTLLVTLIHASAFRYLPKSLNN